jgi:CDP-diacylglycerol--glycerol-3-phosphate 3-phosphatidyltransferase
MSRITPNMITIARILLIPAFVVALLGWADSQKYGDAAAWTAFAIFAIAAGTDGLDGYLARSRRQVTTLGIFLDPLADKLLVTAALVGLVELNKLAAWVALVIISREFAVTGFRMLAAAEGEVIAAHWLGKIKTAAQIAMVLALIPKDAPETLANVLVGITVVLTVVSAAEYLWKGRDLLRAPAGDEAPVGVEPLLGRHHHHHGERTAQGSEAAAAARTPEVEAGSEPQH